MKKTGKILTFSAAMIASAGLTGCFLYPEPSLYAGPDFSEDYKEEDNVQEAVYAGPDFYNDYNEEDNVNEDIYAGPDFWDESSDDSQPQGDDTENSKND